MTATVQEPVLLTRDAELIQQSTERAERLYEPLQQIIAYLNSTNTGKYHVEDLGSFTTPADIERIVRDRTAEASAEKMAGFGLDIEKIKEMVSIPDPSGAMQAFGQARQMFAQMAYDVVRFGFPDYEDKGGRVTLTKEAIKRIETRCSVYSSNPVEIALHKYREEVKSTLQDVAAKFKTESGYDLKLTGEITLESREPGEEIKFKILKFRGLTNE